MQNAIIDAIEKKQLKTEVPVFRIGDAVKVHSRIVEGEKSRIQVFEGTVVGLSRRGARTTFTVRKVVAGIGVEKTFVLHSPNVEKVVVIKRGKVRRAKLYYLRERIGAKATRIKDAAD
jgi:large subunit ribosomal protein L19